ncbi:hypothetical protein FB45DRAFT_881012 [Roridomyces roridus]|uniref:Uncharacterized protein n=1 Tax=Roridomyces roridus TaxID=1738132 RepID=A0AAD7AY75_9AGAR|nr:hypothetical protein FB45DRAFT_881012 [Roridomyces roridus]
MTASIAQINCKNFEKKGRCTQRGRVTKCISATAKVQIRRRNDVFLDTTYINIPGAAVLLPVLELPSPNPARFVRRAHMTTIVVAATRSRASGVCARRENAVRGHIVPRRCGKATHRSRLPTPGIVQEKRDEPGDAHCAGGVVGRWGGRVGWEKLRGFGRDDRRAVERECGAVGCRRGCEEDFEARDGHALRRKDEGVWRGGHGGLVERGIRNAVTPVAELAGGVTN